MAAKRLPVVENASSDLPATLLADDVEARAARFKALSDPTRIQLLHLVAGAGRDEACVCDLTAAVGMSQPTVSHHLRILVEAGLLARERRGTWAWYRLADAGLEAAATSLAF